MRPQRRLVEWLYAKRVRSVTESNYTQSLILQAVKKLAVKDKIQKTFNGLLTRA